MFITRRLAEIPAKKNLQKQLSQKSPDLTHQTNSKLLRNPIVNRYLKKVELISQNRPLTEKDISKWNTLKRSLGKRVRFLYNHHKIDLIFSVGFLFSTNLLVCFWWAGNGAGEFIWRNLNKDYKIAEWAKWMFEVQINAINGLLDLEGDNKLQLEKLLMGESHSGKFTQALMGWIIFCSMESFRWIGYYFLTILCIRRGFFKKWKK